MKKWFGVVLLAVFLFSAAVGYATHTTTQPFELYYYPTWNSLWMTDDKSHRGDLIYISTNDCTENTSLETALSNMGTETKDPAVSAGFPDLGTSGFAPTRARCDGTTGSTIDVKLDFLACDAWNQAEGLPPGTDCTGPNNYGGHVYARDQASEAFCNLWSVAYPCGTSMIYVRFNKARWDARTTAWRNRLVTHEFSHVGGLKDYCATASVTNNGTSGCGDTTWLTQKWTNADLQGLSNTNHRTNH